MAKNDKCESNIPGLYAAGDALGSYMAGAIYTQISSSLAESAVQGAIAAYSKGADGNMQFEKQAFGTWPKHDKV